MGRLSYKSDVEWKRWVLRARAAGENQERARTYLPIKLLRDTDWALPRESATRMLPTAYHVSYFDKEYIGKRFCEQVHFLFGRAAISYLYFSQQYKWSKVVVFQCNVFCAGCKFLCGRHDNARLIILVDFANKVGSVDVKRNNSLISSNNVMSSITSRNDWERAMHSDSAVLSAISVCRQLTWWIGQLVYMMMYPVHDITFAVSLSFGFRPASSKIGINIALQTFRFDRLVNNATFVSVK